MEVYINFCAVAYDVTWYFPPVLSFCTKSPGYPTSPLELSNSSTNGVLHLIFRAQQAPGLLDGVPAAPQLVCMIKYPGYPDLHDQKHEIDTKNEGTHDPPRGRSIRLNRPFRKLELPGNFEAAPCNHHAIEAHVYSWHFGNNAPISDLFRDYESPQ